LSRWCVLLSLNGHQENNVDFLPIKVLLTWLRGKEMLFLLLLSVLISSSAFALPPEYAIIIDKGEVIVVSPDSIYGAVIGDIGEVASVLPGSNGTITGKIAIGSNIAFYSTTYDTMIDFGNPCTPDKMVRREKGGIVVCRSSITGREYRIDKNGNIIFGLPKATLYW
jgi:hypothetical protein